MKIPFVDFGLAYKKIKPEIDAEIQRVLSNGDLILRDDVKKFEENLAKFVGTKYAVGVNSGTDALFLSLKAAGIKKGDEIITVSNTFIATIQVIVHCAAKPILIDVKEDGLMDVDLIEQAITKKTKAIIPVHLSGGICDMSRITAIADKYHLKVIEDAAQAIGASHRGKKAGDWGLTGCFSFYPAKILGCYGDAGAITTNDKKVADKIYLLRDHCQDRKQNKKVVGWGYNNRIDNLQAAILNVKFKYLQKVIKRRIEIAKMYDKGLKDLPIGLPVKQSVYQDYIVCVKERDKFVKYLENKVETLVRNKIPDHKLLGLDFNLPITERLAREEVRLPINETLTNQQVSYIIKKIKEFYEN